MISINDKEFKFTESAYLLLSDYNSFLKRTIKDKDRLNDIEIQISVLLEMENETGKTESLVTIEIMKEVISVLKENQKIDFQPGRSRQKSKTYRKKRKTYQKRFNEIKRDTENNILGGVCSGIANRFNIDPVFVRILFVAASFVFGIFAALYVILWIVLPEEELTYIRTV